MKRLNSLLFGFLIFAVAACGPSTGDVRETDTVTAPGLTDVADGLNGAPTYTYFRVTGRDHRRCAFPMCGGLYVKQVNTTGRTTYVAEIDYSQLGLEPTTLSEVQKKVEHGDGLLRGEIETRSTGRTRYRVLVATEAWLASSGHGGPPGRFFRLQNNGIVCITYPCFSLHAARLNQPHHRDASDIDLSASGAPQEEIDKALEALGTTSEGILAAGVIRKVPNAGPAGTGATFVATQFYLKAAPPPR